MDMSHDHGGMSMGGTTGGFQMVNKGLAEVYWYLIAGFIGALILIRVANYVDLRTRLKACSQNLRQFPTRPSNPISQAWATATAIGREMSYPQLYVPGRFFSWATPPPLGRLLILGVYWAVIIYMSVSDAIVKDAYFWERIGFRNAWMTVMQVPLLYILATKASVLGAIIGSSHERLNWLHRWVARTMLVTGAVHGFYFYEQWVIYDFVEDELDMMPMVKFGFGAWAILAWSVLTSFSPLRHAWYELFVAQHILAAIAFIVVLFYHVPTVAQWYLWFAVAAICSDRFVRGVLLVWQNIKFKPNSSKCKGGQRIGHQAQLRAVGDSITVVTIKDVHFKWAAGQHLYLWIPRVGPTEAHPYTIASAHQLPDTCICNSIQLVVRKHKGFSKRLHQHAARSQSQGKSITCTVFVSGPFGRPPRWDVYETLVLISASTGASFTLPILESVLSTKKTVCTKRIDFLLAARCQDEIEYYVQLLEEFSDRAKDAGIELRVQIAITKGEPIAEDPLRNDEGEGEGHALSSSNDQRPGNEKATSVDIERAADNQQRHRISAASNSSNGDCRIHKTSIRPDIANFIRGPVEATGGETSVVVCGGKSLVATARNCVARLSDERAVHKGTGAQGIHLHVEEYSF
ncbi:hypothetical protein MCOR25_004890 [Pyricularia grisea]|uniref:ferric-chelate reductase (NADPH) n=1 Tax=Pyricularia grisea TaxID=148305 RepID=A0A6P8BJ34_PYRGI|nr:uncharacterized protein PgNI_02566 [Pyricularia grisea]KAI6367525.1 hypothetical protein MCOR25_004890 [Pyricularia grisea]TLD16592.1 hypothetical protein PgNI_02566 [Pyricularia grisea]